MRLTTSYRDQASGVLTGTKHHYLQCHVEFTHEERAIIEERGLYDLFVNVPASTPIPTQTGDFAAKLMRGAGLVLAPIGLLISCAASLNPRAANGAAAPAGFMLVVGIALFALGKYKDWEANRRILNPDQTLTIRRLLTNPDFVVHAYTLDSARQAEEYVRNTLASLAEKLRQNVLVPEKTTYEL